MTKADIIGVLKGLDDESQRRWMFNFGYQLTVWARDCYANDSGAGDTKALMGFNEIQHRVYGRIASLKRQEQWTEESYITGIVESAQFYGIEGQVGAALKKSINEFRTVKDV